MTVHKMHFCINGKKPGGFWLCHWTSQTQAGIWPTFSWAPSGGTMNCDHYELCHKGSLSPRLSLVSSLNTLLSLEGQLSWPAAGCFDLMPVSLVCDTCNQKKSSQIKSFPDMVCLILSTLTSARGPQRRARRRNCSWCRGVQTGKNRVS